MTPLLPPILPLTLGSPFSRASVTRTASQATIATESQIHDPLTSAPLAVWLTISVFFLLRRARFATPTTPSALKGGCGTPQTLPLYRLTGLCSKSIQNLRLWCSVINAPLISFVKSSATLTPRPVAPEICPNARRHQTNSASSCVSRISNDFVFCLFMFLLYTVVTLVSSVIIFSFLPLTF